MSANELPSDSTELYCSHGVPLPQCPDMSAHHWMAGLPEPTDEPPSDSPWLVRCEDPECSVAWAYRDPPAEHWHPRPHGPDWSVFGLVDDT